MSYTASPDRPHIHAAITINLTSLTFQGCSVCSTEQVIIYRVRGLTIIPFCYIITYLSKLHKITNCLPHQQFYVISQNDGCHLEVSINAFEIQKLQKGFSYSNFSTFLFKCPFFVMSFVTNWMGIR